METKETGIFSELHAIIVPVHDMEKSRKFYEQILELIPKKVLPQGFMTVYGLGGSSHLCLYTSELIGEKPGYASQGCFANFRSANIKATYEHLVENDIKCCDIQEGEGVKFFSFFDPDGNRFDVSEFGSEWL